MRYFLHNFTGAIRLRFLFIFNLLWIVGCSVSEPVQEQLAYRLGMRRPPDSLNPYVSTRLEGEIIARRLFPQLFTEQEPTQSGLPVLTPFLVESYQWDETGTKLSLEIKQGLQWSDGQPVTADDVAYSFKVQKNEKLAWVSMDRKSRIMSWQVSAKNRLTVQFDQPSPFNLLDLNEGVIIPKHYFNQWPTDLWLDMTWEHELVTFGPYVIGEWTPGERLILKPKEPSSIPELGFVFVRDKEALFQLVKSGELDYAWGLPVARIHDLKTIAQPVIFPDLTFAFIGWNPLQLGAYQEANPQTPEALAALLEARPHPLFANPKVRSALTHAIQRGKHLQDFWQGFGQLPANPWQAGLPFRNKDLKPLSYNLQLAISLLEEEGWVLRDGVRQKGGIPFRFKVVCNSGSPIREAYLLAVQKDLKELGVTMEIEMMEGGLYIQACSTRNFDAMFGSFRTGTRPDLGSLYSDEAALGGFNFCSWTGLSALLAAVQNADSPESLDQAILSLEQQFQKQQPLTMLYRGMNIAAGKKTLQVKANALDYLFGIEDW